MEKFTIKEAAKYLGYSESGIRSAIYLRKTLPSKKEGTRMLIKKEDLDEYKLKDKIRLPIFKRYDKSIVSEWMEMYQQGYSFKVIGNKYNVNEVTISKQLKIKYPDFVFDLYNFKLSQEEKIVYREAKEFYYSTNNISVEDVTREFEITSSKFKCYLKRTGNSIKGRGIIKGMCVNHDFFNEIDNEIKAYLLGFFAADGHIEFKDKSYCLKIGVKINDSHILMLYNRFICDDKASILICNNRMATINIGSKEIGEALIKLGYDNNKTYSCKSIPLIREDLYPHFIRGVFDGDGSMSLNRRINKKRLNGYNRQFAIASLSYEILEQIANKIGFVSYTIETTAKKGDIRNKLNGSTIISTEDCYQLRVSSDIELKKVYNYMYSNSNFYFKRKKDLIELSLLDTIQIDEKLQGIT